MVYAVGQPEYETYRHDRLVSFVSPFIQANAIRGVLAAVGCAVLFALLAVVYKFRWRGNGDKVRFHDFFIKPFDIETNKA